MVRTLPSLFGASIVLCAAANAATVSLPFSTNFDSGVTIGSGTSNTFVQGGTLANSTIAPITTGSSDLVLRQSAAANNASASVAGVVAGTSFSISTTFTVATYTNSGTVAANMAIGFLGDGTNLSGGSRYYMAYSLTNGSVAFQKNGGNIGTNSGGTIAATPGTVITLSLNGTYQPNGTLSLTGTATSGSTVINLSASDATPLTGNNHGVRMGTISGATMGLDYTYFSVVPEPASAALASVAGLLATLRRRR